MKQTNLKIWSIICFALFSATLTAQHQELDVHSSTIEWIGKKVTGMHQGEINLLSGHLIFNNEEFIGGEFEVDMTSIEVTDLEGNMKSKLEGHLKSEDFFGVDKHPKSQLTITEVTPKSNDMYDVKGDLTIKGQTHSISFPATILKNEGKIEASAELKIDRAQYNVRYGSDSFFDNLGDKVIYDEFTLNVHLKAK